MSIHNRRLTEVLNRTRLAVIGAQSPTTTPAPVITTRPTEPPRPVIRPPLPAQLPPAPSRPSCAELGTITDLDALRSGPRRLLELLYQVAVSAVRARAYGVAPNQVTVHQPQELIAKALGSSLKSVYNWTGDLIAAGLLSARAHYTSSRGATRIDGTLYAVSLKAGHRAHLAHDDLSFEWRDLDADRAAGNTAWKMLTGSDPGDRGMWLRALQNWAAVPGLVSDPPLVPDPVNRPGTLRDAAHALPLIATAHPTKRPALIGVIASTIASALDDTHSRRFWCKALWKAWTAEVEGRAGLQVFGAQLARLEADRREWPGLRKPAALLVSRLTP